MEEIDILKGRIRDLSSRAASSSYLTHTDFLSLSEQALFFQILKEEHVSHLNGKYGGVNYLLYGGHEDHDRKLIYFLPYYLSKEELLAKEGEGETFSLLHVYPSNRHFADVLTHRDYLGALMHLGFKREMFGDILTDGMDGYIFVLNQVIPMVKEELIKIKHTSVETEILKPKDCPFKPKFEEKNVNVSACRLDCVLAEVFHLSRRDSQVLIASESIFINGMSMMNNAYNLKENDRVSIKGHGKFIYLGQSKVTKKGRLFVKVKVYC